MPEQMCDVGRDIRLCCETFGDPSDPTALLVMGLGMQMVAWHEDFCRELAGRGLHVVRFDNRDVGRSTHIGGSPPTIAQLLRRSRSAAHYTLGDMADDAAGLLAALDLSDAHVIGASMGGMIAQMVAIRHPERVRSLVSMMSNTGSRWQGQPSLSVYPIFLRRAPATREEFIEHSVRLFETIGSRELPGDVDDLRTLAAASYDRDRDSAGPGRQLAAILSAHDRTRELRALTVPTVVVHGAADRLVRPSGGRATARAIAGSRLVMIDGMGHDLPRRVWSTVMDAILDNASRAEPQRGLTRRRIPQSKRLTTKAPVGVTAMATANIRGRQPPR